MFSNEGSEDIPNAKAMFDGREEDLLCESDITHDMVINQLNRLVQTNSWYRGSQMVLEKGLFSH